MDDVLLLLTTLNTIRTWGRVQHRLVHQHSSGSSRIFERFKTDMNQTNTLMSIHQLQRTAIKRLCLLDDFPVWTIWERDYRDAQVNTQLARHMWINLPKYSPKSWYWRWCYMHGNTGTQDTLWSNPDMDSQYKYTSEPYTTFTQHLRRTHATKFSKTALRRNIGTDHEFKSDTSPSSQQRRNEQTKERKHSQWHTQASLTN